MIGCTDVTPDVVRCAAVCAGLIKCLFNQSIGSWLSLTRHSSIAEGSHDDLCQLLHRCTKNHTWKCLQ